MDSLYELLLLQEMEDREEDTARRIKTRPVLNILEGISEEEFRETFRLTKILFNDLVTLVSPFMAPQVKCNHVE